LRSPTIDTCGSSWPRTTSTLSRAASSVKSPRSRSKLLLAASASASSRVAGKPDARAACISRRADDRRPARNWPAGLEVPSALIRCAVACASEDSACATSVRVTSPTRNRSRVASSCRRRPARCCGDLDQRLVAHDVEIGLGDRLKDRGLDPERLGAVACTVLIACRVCASVRPPR
jgi:hypothetical protein